MKQTKRTGKIAILLYALTLMLVSSSIALSADSANTVQQIKKLQSAAQRHLFTKPQKAEKEWFEAQELLHTLKEVDPENKQFSSFEKKLSQLKPKLEKRLGHSLGEETGKTQVSSIQTKKSSHSSVSQKNTTKKSTLPNSVINSLKKVNKSLDAVEEGLEKFRLQTAQRKMKEANKNMAQMLKRYAKKIPKGDEQVAATKKRLETVSIAYGKAQEKEAARIAAEEEKARKREEQSQKWCAQMAPFFTHDGPLYLRYGAEFNTGNEAEKVEYRKAYDKAIVLMEEYEKTKFPNGKTHELANKEMKLRQLVLDYKEDQIRDKRDAACKKWVDSFRAYVSPGSGTDKYLVRSVMFGKDHVNRQAKLLEEAKGVWAEYQKEDFPFGKTLTLMNLEKEMAEAIKEMPEIIRQCKALVSGDIEKEFDHVLARLEKDNGWKTDKNKMPYIAMKRDLEPLSHALDEYAATVEPNDTTLKALKEKLELIHKKDQENRKVCAERRYMRPWKYSGSDGSDIEKAAGNIVKKEFPKAKVLRITLPATSWEEERVLEYTDTTHTAVRYRITQFMPVDVAAKDADGKVYLHVVHVAADRKSAGEWGGLYGNVKWSDWMLEENVKKKAPIK